MESVIKAIILKKHLNLHMLLEFKLLLSSLFIDGYNKTKEY